jgi:NlpC/P60 family putative phage cell wall peptidase
MRRKVEAAALTWLGTPYHHGAAAKGAGCDCLGLLRGVWADLYGEQLPVVTPYSPAWGEGVAAEDCELLLTACARWLVPTKGYMAIGCVVVLRPVTRGPAKHCGILTADGLIHSVKSHGVVLSDFNLWQRKLVAIFDFPGDRHG